MASANYYLEDDTLNGTATAGGSGAQVSPIFVSDTLAHAQTTAQQWSTMFQRNCRLVPVGGAPPYTQYTPAASGSAIGSQATGISF